MTNTDRTILGYYNMGYGDEPDRVEIARYDRAAHIYVEYIDREKRGKHHPRKRVSLSEAAKTLAEALWVDVFDGEWFKGRQFVARFDKAMEREAARLLPTAADR